MRKPAPLYKSQLRKGTRKRRVAADAVNAPRPQLTSAGQPVALLEEHFCSPEALSVTFQYFNPNAKEVFIAGSFNNWQLRATALRKQAGGKWATELLLHPGCYEYRLLVDKKWQDDPLSPRFVTNPFGGLNSVVEVKALRS